MKIVYVTGCLGFIGAQIVRECLDRGWYVLGIDKMTYASNPHFVAEFSAHSNFKFLCQDINDIDRLVDCDYIINTAAETHVDNSIMSSGIFLQSNINGVHHLLELIKEQPRYKAPTLIHFSTDEVYGDVENGAHVESDYLKPSNPYSASKAAVIALTKSIGKELADTAICVNCVTPAAVKTLIFDQLTPEHIQFMLSKIPMGRFGTPDEIAAMVAWLCTDDCSFSTGATFDLSGGRSTY
jgi:dTDP-D-glucose 4,6-dehydratase